MDLDVKSVAVLLLIAAVVAMLTRRLHLPYSVGLVAAGVFLALLPFSPKVELTRDLIFTALLPPLLFEAAFFLSWEKLQRDFPLVAVLATRRSHFGRHHVARNVRFRALALAERAGLWSAHRRHGPRLGDRDL